MPAQPRQQFVDALGRTVSVPLPAARIVSLVPSITEALFAFGAGDAVAGVTKFCVEPPEAVADKPRIGGTKDPNIEAIAALQPDLVIANVEENREEDVQALTAAGITVFVTYPRTVPEGIETIETIARMTGAERKAGPAMRDARAALAEPAGDARSPRIFCPIWRRPWMTIGPGTYMHDMITVCGGHNIFDDATDRYPQTTLEEVTTRQPEVILLPDEPYPFTEKHVAELRELEQVPAVRNGRIYLVDGKDLCWYGPRIGRAIRAIRSIMISGARA